MAGATVQPCPNHTPTLPNPPLPPPRATSPVNHSARIDLGTQETVNDHPCDSKISNGGAEASPQRVRAGRGPARRQAHAPPAVLLDVREPAPALFLSSFLLPS